MLLAGRLLPHTALLHFLKRVLGHATAVDDGGVAIIVFSEFEPQQRHACRDRSICADLPILLHLWSEFYLELACVQDQRAVLKFDGDFTQRLVGEQPSTLGPICQSRKGRSRSKEVIELGYDGF